MVEKKVKHSPLLKGKFLPRGSAQKIRTDVLIFCARGLPYFLMYSDILLHVHVRMSENLLFRIAMWWRIIYGFLRIFVGVTFLKLNGQQLSELTYQLMAHEITGPTGDAVLEHVYSFFEIHDFTVTYFIAIYFLFWGFVEIILALCLLRRIESAFPITMGLIVLFICYGVFRYTHTHSGVLALVLVIDVAILYLINTEYKKLKREKFTHV